MNGPIRTYIFECHHCNTQGQLYDPELDVKVQCPICLGRGQRQTRAMHGVDQGCPNCGGMGRWIEPESGIAEPCPRCQAQGLVTELSDGS
jgi:DnaJ-class molecular chaperone